MSELVERLPWRLAALGGLLVGTASLLVGIDLWQTLLRVGAAFAFFWALGWGLRAVLRGVDASPAPHQPRRGNDKTGTHVDEKTPDMTPSDLHPNDPSQKPPTPGRDG